MNQLSLVEVCIPVLVLLDLNVITLSYSSMDQILSFSPPSQKLSWLYFFFSLFIQVAYKSFVRVHLVCFCYCCSVTKSCPTLCDSMDCSTPGFLVLYYIPEFALIHVHWVSDAIQPCHSLLPPPPLCLKLSQHQGLFQWVSSSNQVTKELKLQHQLFQLIFRIDYLQDWLVWFPCCPRGSQESSPAP